MINKLENIILLCYKHNITAYEIEKNTGLNASGVQRILNKEVIKPREKTMDTILEYIQKKLSNEPILDDLLKEETETYQLQEPKSIEEKIADAVEKRLKPYFDELKK